MPVNRYGTKSWTVRVENGALGTTRFEGVYETEEAAQERAAALAARTRKFMSYEVWTGTPRAWLAPVGPKIRGEC